MVRYIKSKVYYFILPGLIIICWEILVLFDVLDSQFISSPFEIIRVFFKLLFAGNLLLDIFMSLQRVIVGFLLAAPTAISLGILSGYNKNISNLIIPLVEILRPIPPIAWIPIAILLFGLGNMPAYAIVFLGSFFPIFSSAYFGVKSINNTYINIARSFEMKRLEFIKYILLPASMPAIFSGLRIGLGVAWMSVIAAELIGAQSGLGYMIQMNRLLLQTDKVIAGMIAIGITGFLMNRLLFIIEKRILVWN